MRYLKSSQAVLAAMLLPWAVVAQSEEPTWHTDWLDLVKGYRGDKAGVELRDVEQGDTAESRKITLAIPKKSLSDPDAIEHVIVIGRKPEKPEPILDISYEWLDDYENDNYGLVIHLNKGSRWPIRLYMFSDTGFIR